MRKVIQRLKFWKKHEDEEGQGIVEYAMLIAFVSVLIAVAFGLSRGSMYQAISSSYSSANSALNALNLAAQEAGKPN